MKTTLVEKKQDSGNVLALTLIVALVLGLSLVSFITLANGRSSAVSRSQLWNESLIVSEAGVEDALAYVNKYVGSPNVTNWISSYSQDNWQNSGNVYWVTRYLDTAQTRYYTVYITNGSTGPIIRSTGYVASPSWVTGGTRISRTILVGAKSDTYFNAAMASLGAINLKGNNIATDSFDSNATNWPGYWTNTIRLANGDVVTDDTITNSVLNVGNANVAGNLKTGPSGSVQIGANGSVGDLPWVDSNTPGIEPGHYQNDLNVIFKDVVVPTVTWWSPTSAPGDGGAALAPDGKTYDHVFLAPANGGFYTLRDSGDIYVGTNVFITVRVVNNVGTFAPNNLFVAGSSTNSGKFVAYVDCPTVNLGTSDQPQSGVAGNMVFMGTPNCTSLNYKGNGDFTGAMYMPEANFQLAGGGSGTPLDFIGSAVTKSVQMNGHYHFHYDEALKKWSPGAYVVASWREL